MKKEKNLARVTVTMPAALVDRIDTTIHADPYMTTRTQFILRLIEEHYAVEPYSDKLLKGQIMRRPPPHSAKSLSDYNEC